MEKIVESYKDDKSVQTAEQRIHDLDKAVRGKALRAALVPGVVGLVLFGIGMSVSLQESDYFILGIVVGVMGLALLVMTYPIYSKKLVQEKDLVRGELLDLASQLH